MARGIEFSPVEIDLLLENYDRPLKELVALFKKKNYNRSAKSISRKIEKMRQKGEIGLRSDEAVKRAYQLRGKKPVAEAQPTLRGGDGGFGGPSFSSGDGWDKSSWDDED